MCGSQIYYIKCGRGPIISMKTIDVIIPTYKPDNDFLNLLKMLEEQTVPIQKIIIMNTEEKYWNNLVYGSQLFDKYKNIEIRHLSKLEFDHGRTRDSGIKRSTADFFICMTQDAAPVDCNLVENLLKPFEDDKTVVSYARQLPVKNSDEIECFSRKFNYPEESLLKSIEDLPRLGIKTYFCSNVCAAYKREVYNELGGFIKHTIFNEDMIFAANALKAGYRVAYTANAMVYHSHHYTNKVQFSRNFDIGVSQVDHPEIFADIPSETEGIRYIKMIKKHLKETHNMNLIFSLYITSAYKYLGYRLGKNYRRLPKSLVLKWTMNKDYWRHESLLQERGTIDPKKGYGRSEEEAKR